MTAARVLVVGGLDPTGRAGIARDLAVLESERADAAVVPTCLTVQDKDGVRRVDPVNPRFFAESLKAATTDRQVDAVKIGLIAESQVANALERFVSHLELPVVFDPVFRASGSHPLTTEDTLPALRALLARATLVTPNLPELAALSGRRVESRDDRVGAARALQKNGASAVLVKGGHGSASRPFDLLVVRSVREFPFERLLLSDPTVGRGKGCELATRIAVHLARKLPLDGAVKMALRRLRERLEREILLSRLSPNTQGQLRSFESVLDALLARLRPACVPEVGMNLAYAPAHATSPQDVIGLAGRVTISGRSFAVTGRPQPGGPHHTGLIARTAQRRLGRGVWVLNHRHEPAHVAGLGKDHIAFSRHQEPATNGSSMEWMTEAAIDRLGRLPAFISDPGLPGKEAMVRILAHTSWDLLEQHEALHRLAGAPKGARPVERSQSRMARSAISDPG